MNDFKNSYRVFKVGGIHEIYIQALDPAPRMLTFSTNITCDNYKNIV